MGFLKPDERHRVTIEVTGRKIEDVTRYMAAVRKLAKRYGARIVEKKKSKMRRKKSR